MLQKHYNARGQIYGKRYGNVYGIGCNAVQSTENSTGKGVTQLYSAVKIDHEAVVALIEARRKEKGLSIRTTCERALILEDTYSNIVRGKSTFSSAAYLFGLSYALDIPLEELARALLPNVEDWSRVFPERVVEIIQPMPEVLPVAAPSEPQPPMPISFTVDMTPLAAHMDTAHEHMMDRVDKAHDAIITEYKDTVADLRKSRRILFWVMIVLVFIVLLYTAAFTYVIIWEYSHPNAGVIQWEEAMAAHGANVMAFFQNL